MCGLRPFTASLVISADDVRAADIATHEGDDELPGRHVTVGIGPLVLQPAVDEYLPGLLRALADRVERVTAV